MKILTSGLILIQVLDGDIVGAWVGGGAPEIAGYNKEEIQSDPKRWIENAHGDCAQQVRDSITQAAAGIPASYECSLIRKDGRTRRVREEWIPAASGDGESKSVAGIIIDISHKPSETEWLNVFKHMVDDSPQAVTIRDMSGVILYCNASCANLYAFPSPEHALGTNYTDVLPPGYIDSFFANIWPQITHAPWTGELSVIKQDGELITISVATNVLRDANNNPTAVYAFFTNIDEQLRAKHALQESEEKYRNLVERATDGVTVIQDADIKFVNPRFVEMSGYPSEQLMGTDFTQYLLPSENQRLYTRYLQRMRGEPVPAVYETQMTRADGSKIDVEINAGLISYEGRPADLILFRDITHRTLAREREKKHSARLASLADVDQKFVSSLDTSSIIESATKVTAESLGCLCLLLGVHPETGRLYHINGNSDYEYLSIKVERALKEADITIETIYGKSGVKKLSGESLDLVSKKLSRFTKKSETGPFVLLPVYSKQHLLGLLAGFRRKGEPAFDDEDVWFISEIASHATAALTNAAYYDHQKTIADTLQRSLIPASPNVKGLDSATYYSPATEGVEVGGDFFDIISFQDGRVGIVVGDVSGKGIEAAIHTAEAKYMLRGFALQDPDPGSVITALNEGLRAFISDETFVTLTYILVDMSGSKLQYVNAGHEPSLILCTKDQTVNELKPNGPILGVTKGWHYATGSTTLEPDEFLFCYTDGLTDVPVDSERFGYERLVETLRSASGVKTSNELMWYVIETVNEAGNRKQPDDQVIVTIRLCG